jgi:hypothetical protein
MEYLSSSSGVQHILNQNSKQLLKKNCQQEVMNTKSIKFIILLI